MMDEADWIAAMEAEPENAGLMGLFADWLDERNDPRAGLFRLLWETGKVGQEAVRPDSYTYFSVTSPSTPTQIGDGLWMHTRRRLRHGGRESGLEGLGRVQSRLAFARTWADADEDTRELWRTQFPDARTPNVETADVA